MNRKLCLIALMTGLMSACAPSALKQQPAPRPEFRAVAESDAALDTDPTDIAVLNRLSWGADTADAQLLQRVGLSNWLDRQLHPPADDGLPPEAQSQIAAMEISRENLVQINDQLRAEREAAQAKKGTPDFEA